MTSRKNSMMFKPPGMGAQYLDAVNTMNDSTMVNLCELLLDDNDDTSLEKMKQIHEECVKAATIIAQKAPAPAMPTHVVAPGLRHAARGSSASKTILPRGRMISIPKLGSSKRLAMERQKSDTSNMMKTASVAPPPKAVEKFLNKLNNNNTTQEPKKEKSDKTSAAEPSNEERPPRASSRPLPPPVPSRRTQPARASRK